MTAAVVPEYPPEFVEPAYCWVPPGRRGTYGPKIVDWTAGIGHPVDPEQAAALDVFGSYGPGGMWHTFETCIIEGRQNGKTDRVLLPLTLYEFFILSDVFGPSRMTWTAHLMDTCRDAFVTTQVLIANNPELSARVKDIVEAKSEEAIELTNGSVLEFRARTGGGGRGKPGRAWVADEALILPATVMDARLPTVSAQPNPQVRYASSPGLETSDHLARLVKRGRAGNDPSLAYVEFCAPGSWDKPGCLTPRCGHQPGTPGCTLDREELYHLGNHSAGRRISYATMRHERQTMTPLGFGRERFGWHEVVVAAGDADRPVKLADWAARAITVKPDPAPLVFFVEVGAGSRCAAISFGQRVDGSPYMELADHRAGVDWLPARCKYLREKYPDARWFRDEKGAIEVELEALKLSGVEPEPLTLAQMVAGCALTEKLAPIEGGMWHDGSDGYRLALESSSKRSLGDKDWLWGWRKSAGDISPIVTASGVLAALEMVHEAEPFFVWG